MNIFPHFRSVSARLIAVLVLFFAVGARAETINALSDAEIQGRELARQLCEARPVENFTNTGVLKIRNRDGYQAAVQIRFQTIVFAAHWQTFFETTSEGNRVKYLIDHRANQVFRKEFRGNETIDCEVAVSFAGSDFSLGDLGLEFLHWPTQKILPKTTTLKRGREYTLLESTNPNPSTSGYSRVLSWIDKESGGILQAEAYDARGKLLKVFEPKSFKKVNGQWELQEMEIRNVQTGSRTRLEFDLKN